MNCVHLENCLHETTEDAHTNLCAADRRVSEYNALSSKAVKMHSLFERFRSCVTAPGAVDSFADSLHSFAMSLPRYLLIVYLFNFSRIYSLITIAERNLSEICFLLLFIFCWSSVCDCLFIGFILQHV